ncbi:DUF1566 domain-containing protein [Thermodesulfobacteriota bacterium]
MKSAKITMIRANVTMLAVAVMLSMPVVALAGNLEPNAEPGPTMHTLDEIYDAVTAGCPDPGSASCDGVSVARTGQTISYAVGDDGDHEAGVATPNPRFTDNADGTVNDNRTGLIWMKNANCFGTQTWANAITAGNTVNSGECGLSDGSAEGDWRLPNLFELESLRDMGNHNPALPTGHPFTGVQSTFYWSGTSYSNNTVYAFDVDMYSGIVSGVDKSDYYYVWPVRGGAD